MTERPIGSLSSPLPSSYPDQPESLVVENRTLGMTPNPRSDSVVAWKRAGKAVLRRLPRRWVVWRGPKSRSEIALTFDDGPDPTYTPRILEVLRRFDVQATFFVVGERAAQHPELTRRILREGHELASHSQTHPDFERLSWRQAQQEIARSLAVIEDAQGHECRLFRPPKGKLCMNSVAGAWRRRLTVVMWSVDLKDFRAHRPEEITDALGEETIEDGDVVLYHGNSEASLAALPRVIALSTAGGRRAVTISSLLRVQAPGSPEHD